MSALGRFFAQPLQGVTSLWRVTWLYGLLGTLVLTVAGALLVPASLAGQRLYGLVELLYSVYVTIATYRCAGNCKWPFMARLVRICAVLSLLLVPLLAYLIFAVDVSGLDF